jgi:hypothetical protein
MDWRIALLNDHHTKTSYLQNPLTIIYFLYEINIIELIFDNIINNQLKKYMSDKSADKKEEG